MNLIEIALNILKHEQRSFPEKKKQKKNICVKSSILKKVLIMKDLTLRTQYMDQI